MHRSAHPAITAASFPQRDLRRRQDDKRAQALRWCERHHNHSEALRPWRPTRYIGTACRPGGGALARAGPSQVENMFADMPARRNAFRNASEEYGRIMDVVQRYAVHAAHRGISFTCKKVGGSGVCVCVCV